MARPLRIEMAGGLYHVMSRSNERRAFVRDDADLGYRRQSSVGTAVSRVEAAGGSICEALASLQEQLANV
jgi:hypothetical protein